MNRKSQHVVPNLSGGWSVKKGGSSKATKNFNDKKEAEEFGRTVARNQNTELVIHKSDGRIQSHSSYSKNSSSSKGRKK